MCVSHMSYDLKHLLDRSSIVDDNDSNCLLFMNIIFSLNIIVFRVYSKCIYKIIFYNKNHLMIQY